jgi:hypothetical protein
LLHQVNFKFEKYIVSVYWLSVSLTKLSSMTLWCYDLVWVHEGSFRCAILLGEWLSPAWGWIAYRLQHMDRDPGSPCFPEGWENRDVCFCVIAWSILCNKTVSTSVLESRRIDRVLGASQPHRVAGPAARTRDYKFTRRPPGAPCTIEATFSSSAPSGKSQVLDICDLSITHTKNNNNVGKD